MSDNSACSVLAELTRMLFNFLASAKASDSERGNE